MSEATDITQGPAAVAERNAREARLWLVLAAQRRRLGLHARRLLARSTAEMQMLALRGVPDLRLEWLRRLSHAALLAQGAESWTGTVGRYRVHRYAFTGHGTGPAVLLLHGLGGSADSMAPLAAPLLDLAPRVVLLELPGHGRSPAPADGPLAAREYSDVVCSVVDRMYQDYGRIAIVGSSLGGALALNAAHERPDEVAGVVGLNPAGADLSEEALSLLPSSFADERTGAAHMAQLLFHRTPWLFWLVARDFARSWATPTVQRILDDARSNVTRSLGMDVLHNIRAPVLILWGEQDRLLPASSVEDFRRHLPGAQVEVMKGCGHIPQLERPAYTRRRVREFVAGLARS
jgi:pimeloyl-ACP methyl ester carboxylesterase